MNTVMYRWELRKLQRDRTKMRSVYKQEKEQARRDKKSSDEIAEIEQRAWFEQELVDDEIESLESRYLIESAERLILPIPMFSKDSDAWRQSSQLGLNLLTRKGMATLRSTIRAERKERREAKMIWVAAITGILGTLTGLIAVWKS